MFKEKESVFFSNTPLRLMQSVEDELFSEQNPSFVRRYLIVPNMSLKPLFLRKWAKNPHLQIGAGVTFCTLLQFISMITNNVVEKNTPFFSQLELIAHIYTKLEVYYREKNPRFFLVNKYLANNREKGKRCWQKS